MVSADRDRFEKRAECDRRDRALTRIESDAEFQARLRARDAAAFEKLHDAYRPKLLAYLSTWCDHHVAEDIAQDAFLAAWRVLPEYRFDVPLYFFLKRCAHLGALRQWRYSKYRHQDVSINADDEGTAVAVAHLADPAAGDVDEMLMTAQAIDLLNAEQRAVIGFIFGQGLTRGTVARRMRCSVGTIETHVENALRHLRGYFLDEPADLIPTRGAAIAKRAALREQYAAIDRSRLQGRYRAAFELVYGRGLDYDEAARELQSTPSMVRMWTSGAVARLRQHGEIEPGRVSTETVTR